MSHIRILEEYKCRVCHKKATCELINDYSAGSGFFCKKHGEQALKDFQLRRGAYKE